MQGAYRARERVCMRGLLYHHGSGLRYRREGVGEKKGEHVIPRVDGFDNNKHTNERTSKIALRVESLDVRHLLVSRGYRRVLEIFVPDICIFLRVTFLTTRYVFAHCCLFL